MSAQAGIWNFDGKPVDEIVLGKLASAIENFGPDGGNAHIDGSIGMVYRSFHTTPESHFERQPHVTSRGKVITWDGRLDNRDDLLLQLQKDITSAETDLHIVTAAFEKWDVHCFSKFVGDWALSIWDPSEKRIYLARDYMCTRHLYYLPTPRTVVWCTDLASIVALSSVSFTLDDEYIAGYLGAYPEPHLTPYREIQAVPPGHFVTIRDAKAR